MIRTDADFRGEAADPAAGFVLAGGQSNRMGSDKALVQFRGRPLIAHALGMLREAGLAAAIAGARSALDAYAPVVADAQSGLGPLGGVCAALHSTGAAFSVFVSIDLPLLPASLIRFLLEHARCTARPVTLASLNGFAQPFPSVIHRQALPVLQRELNEGRAGCFASFQAAARHLGQAVSILPVEMLVQAGHIADPDGRPPLHWFLNLNSRRDVERAASFRF